VGAVNEDLECCDVGRGSGDVADGQPDSFLFFLVRFAIANYFSVSDLSDFWDVAEFDKETCVGSRNLPNPLEHASAFGAKASFPKWL
jgi:hypothetical protein